MVEKKGAVQGPVNLLRKPSRILFYLRRPGLVSVLLFFGFSGAGAASVVWWVVIFMWLAATAWRGWERGEL